MRIGLDLAICSDSAITCTTHSLCQRVLTRITSFFISSPLDLLGRLTSKAGYQGLLILAIVRLLVCVLLLCSVVAVVSARLSLQHFGDITPIIILLSRPRHSVSLLCLLLLGTAALIRVVALVVLVERIRLVLDC